MMTFFFFLLSFVIGILTGFLSWKIVTKVFVPQIEISDFISKSLDPSNKQTKYRIKIVNTGRRPAFEFNIIAEIRFRQKDPTSNGNTQIMRIGINTVPLAYLGIGKGRTMNLKTELIPKEHRRHLPEEFQERLGRNERIPLEEILDVLGEDSRIRVYIMCSDGVSGNRKYFVSKDLSKSDITNDKFHPDGVDKLSGGPV